MTGCDRCGADDGTLSLFAECHQCGPVWLCAVCRRTHLREMVEELESWKERP